MSGETKRGDSIDPVMLGLFKTELENHTRTLEAGLVDLEKDQTPQRVEPLMRAAHSIKGAARIVGLDRAVRLAHVMEDLLSAAQRGQVVVKGETIDLLLAGNDVFRELAVAQIAAIPELLEAQEKRIAQLSDSLTAALSAKADAASTSPAAEPDRSAEPQKPAPPAPEAPVSSALAASPSAQNTEESLVRVLAENLNRLMGLTGECLVQAKATKAFSSSLARIKAWQLEVSSALEGLYDWAASEEGLPTEIRARVMQSIARSEQVSDLVRKNIDQFELFSVRLEQLTDRLYSEVVATRMRPFSEGVFAFPRMVRDLAREKGKQVRFEIVGGATRVDRDILEKLESPLTHLLRNAIDHGVETPEERIAQGKPAEAVISLEGRHSSGMLHVAVSDDGRGIDQEKIRRAVVEKGYASAELAVNLNSTELFDFLFLPGFSTADKLTETSGRGVGLDVVQAMTKEVGGTVQVESTIGKGTVFHLRLPLTLSVLRALVVEIASEPYAVPLTRIDRILTGSRENLQILEDRQFCTVDGEPLGLLEASQVLQLPVRPAQSARLHILVISDRLNRYGLVVSRFLGEKDLVVLPLDRRLGRVPNVAAGAILEDGTPVLILDVDDVVRSIDSLVRHGRPSRIGQSRGKVEGARKRVLIVDDSLTVREVERRLLENRGYEVVVAVDGMDGWNNVQTTSFDLVISDVDMPRLDGIELVTRIKANPQLKDLPVMIVSYKDREEDKTRGLEAGANYYLTKSSFDDETLIGAVRDLIGEPK